MQAKTVALWPITYVAVTREENLRSAIDPQDQLQMGDGVSMTSNAGLGWNLPPNPDTSVDLLFGPLGGASVGINSDDEAQNAILWCDPISDELANTIYPRHDHTVEGWVKFSGVPSNWWCVYYPLNGSSSMGGCNFSLRNNGDGMLRWVHYVHGNDGPVVDDVQFGEVFNPDGFTNRWVHVALTFTYQDATRDNQSAWRLYVDGAPWGDPITHAPFTSGAPMSKRLDLGGRIRNTARATKVQFAYWRVSDECLTPERFLNAGGTGTVVPSLLDHPTVAYWKLNKDAFAGVDGQPAVSTVPVSGGLFDAPAENADSFIVASSDCAFRGTPPNCDISFSNGNAGSMFSTTESSWLMAKDLGRQLTVTNSFTVEGWVKPRRDRNEEIEGGGMYLFNTRNTDRGWALQYFGRNGVWYLELYAMDAANHVLVDSARMSGDLTNWSEWKHVALVHDAEAEGGCGTWTCYLDGVESGRTVGASVPEGDDTSINFYIGGRPTLSFFGGIDCVRVSKAALSPDQFLNATGNTRPATDVLALYPLDSVNGICLDGIDLMGGARLTGVRTADHYVAASDDAPIITNPDTHPYFRGIVSTNQGSAGFATVGGAKSYLYTSRSDVCNVFTDGKAWTLEGYFKRSQAMTGNWEILFGTATSIGMDRDSAGMQVNFTYRESMPDYPGGGFILYAEDISGHSDVLIPTTSNQSMPVGEWQHVALSFEKDENNMAIWKLYLNGNLAGQLTDTFKKFEKPLCLLVGGRPSSANSFKGCISNVRLSRAALTPDQLLCAVGTPPAPVVHRTLAYWPMDTKEGTPDLDDRVSPFYPLGDVHSTVGEDAMASLHPQNPDTTETFVGNPRANSGSIRFTAADGHVSTRNLGLKLDVTDEFTVEGWIKWAHAAPPGVEFVVGTHRTAQAAGWFLGIDTRSATPRFSLFSKGGLQTAVLDACFDDDILPPENVWAHIALIHRPRVGNGTWTLYLDGREMGTLENAWPQGGNNTYQTHIFRFGTYNEAQYSAFQGSYDMWRVSQGALSPKEFLYRRPSGTLLLFR